MTDHPLLFRGPMVCAIIEDRKFETRRPAFRANGKPTRLIEPVYDKQTDGVRWVPRWKVGDRVWVKETWAPEQYDPNVASLAGIEASSARPAYRASWTAEPAYKWRPSIHMPRWASRLTLTVTRLKIERLQDISEADAVAEGVQWTDVLEEGQPRTRHLARSAFCALYCSIHGKDAWAANPEVVAITFTVHKANIDALKKAA